MDRKKPIVRVGFCVEIEMWNEVFGVLSHFLNVETREMC